MSKKDNLGPEAYHEYIPIRAKLIEELNGPSRYVPISKRTHTGVYTRDALKNLCHGKYLTNWNGVELGKSPIDIQIYQALFWEMKPRTVFELGTYAGGAAMWMADILNIGGVESHVYSMDIDPTLIDPRARNYNKNITFVEGDCNKIEQALTPQLLENAPHPWVVIEDAHINVSGTFEYFHKYMQTGDYFIIDDTNPETACNMGDGLTTTEYEAIGDDKLNEVRNILLKHEADYAVDSKLTDMFGYNGTWNINGYIRRM